jgi:hypothetical protein
VAAASSSPSIPQDLDEEEMLLPQELQCLRSAELDSSVAVYADLRKGAAGGTTDADSTLPPPQLTLLCEDASVKIFPQLVVLSRPNGSPLVEMVIAELNELTEDDSRGTLAFSLRKHDGSVTVVEVQCGSPAARSTLYKLVCSKRNLLDARK